MSGPVYMLPRLRQGMSIGIEEAPITQMLPGLSWLEREAVNLKVGSSSLPGSVMPSDHPAFCGMREGNDT